MVLSTVVFSAMHTGVRHVSDELNPLQTVFLRNVFGVLVFAPILIRNGVTFLHTRRFRLHTLRAVLNFMAMAAFFTALSMAPLAKVTALSFTAPIFTALLSVMLLGESFRLRRWTATVAGFVGTLVILRPGFVEIDLGSIFVLLSAFLWGITMIVIKLLGRTESSLTTTGYMNILLAAFSLIPAVWVWRWPEPETWLWLVFIGMSGTLGQLALAQALREADITAVMPFDFLKLVWASIFGFMFFTEIPHKFTWYGAIIIFASGFYIAYRERSAAAQESGKGGSRPSDRA